MNSTLIVYSKLFETICASLLSRHKKEQFLYEIIIDDEKSTIIILNVKNHGVGPDQSLTLSPKHYIHKSKVLMCI